MKLTQHTDYALRVLMYLATDDSCPTIGDVAEFFGISKNHLVKVTHRLTKLGYVESIRGRSGGLRLRMQPEEIVIGAVVKNMEANFHVVECFDEETNSCHITEDCKLKLVLSNAMKAFNSHLDSYTIADFLTSQSDRPVDIIASSNESRRRN